MLLHRALEVGDLAIGHVVGPGVHHARGAEFHQQRCEARGEFAELRGEAGKPGYVDGAVIPVPAGNEAQFRELLERNPAYVPGYQMLGQLLARQSRGDDARAVLTQGISAAAKSGNAHAQSEMEGLLAEL